MKVLLVQPFKNPGLFGESYPPVGLGYLASVLRKDGHQVLIVDCLKDNYTYDRFLAKVLEEVPDVLGITLFSISLPFVEKMVDMVKSRAPGIKIVLGGPHVSSLPDNILNNFENADFAVRGEGERPLKELLNCLFCGRDFSRISGLIYRKDGKVFVNETYFPENIEEYGIPAWDIIKPKDYFKYLSLGPDTVPVFFSRGCPFQCTFCAAKVTSGQQLRRRGLDHIFLELNLLKKQYGIKRFIIEDEGFGVSKKFIMDFCRRILSESFHASFAMGVGMRLDIIDKELLTAMRRAGFEKTIVLGIESGSERVLKLMKKQINLDMVREKVDLMNKMGFEPNGYFIVGYPSETRADIEKTIKFALSLNIREASFTAFQPLPATEATNELIEKGELPKDYDFALIAQNTVAYAPGDMTPQELEQIRKRAILRFYLRPKTFLRYLKSKRQFIYAFKKIGAVFFKKNVIESK